MLTRKTVLLAAVCPVFLQDCSVPVVPRGITMAAFSVEKSVFVATSAAIDLAVDGSRMVVYFFNGYIHQHDLYLIPFLIVIGFVGSYIGKLILDKIPQEKFRVLVLALIFIVGITMILKFFGISYFSE